MKIKDIQKTSFLASTQANTVCDGTNDWSHLCSIPVKAVTYLIIEMENGEKFKIEAEPMI